jgi:cell division protease FtsH
MPVPGYTGPRNYSEHTARAIDEAVKEIVTAAFKRAADVLGRHRETLEAAASQLLERETLAEAELQEFAARVAPAAKPAPKSAG